MKCSKSMLVTTPHTLIILSPRAWKSQEEEDEGEEERGRSLHFALYTVLETTQNIMYIEINIPSLFFDSFITIAWWSFSRI